MANIVLKDANGDRQIYNSVNKILVKDTNGEYLKFSYNEEVEIDLPDAFKNIGILYYVETKDGLLLSGNTTTIGVWEYLKADNSFNQLVPDGQWGAYQQLGNGDYLIGGEAFSYGILLYESSQHKITQISTEGGYLRNFIVLPNDDCLICSSNSSSANLGIWLFNSINKTISKVYNSGYNWNYYCELQNGDYLISSTAQNTGVILYNNGEKTITQIYASGSYWYYFMPLSTGNALITGNSSSSSVGVLFYSASTSSISKIYNSGYGWQDYIELDNGNCLVGGTSYSGNQGLWLFSESDTTFTHIYTSSFPYHYFHKLSNSSILASSSNTNTILKYNPNDNSVTTVSHSGSYPYKFFFNLSTGDCLFGGTGTVNSGGGSGIYLYSIDTNTAKNVKFGGYYWDTFNEKDNICIVTSSNSSNPLIVEYDIALQTAKVVGFKYLEE